MARPDFVVPVPAAPVAPVMPPYPGSGATTKSSAALML
jgi:hypothetical protein